jgi:hypothetical protein
VRGRHGGLERRELGACHAEAVAAREIEGMDLEAIVDAVA